MNIGFAI